MKIGHPPEPIIVFPAIHPQSGDVSIWDDGVEATVAVGELTHGHFNPYDESLTETQVAQSVTDSVVRFLDALFEDRVLIWCSQDRRSGGWRMLEEPIAAAPANSSEVFCVWSRPFERGDE